MSDDLKFPESPLRRESVADHNRDALDEPVLSLVRDAYLPAAVVGDSSAYWTGLEQRILARVGAAGLAPAEGQWWSVLGGWAQAGLIAAAALFAVASVVSQRFGEAESRYVYESVIQQETPEVFLAPAALLSAPDGQAQSDATLIYVLSH